MESCADIFRLSAFLCFAITASICFRSLRVSFPADNRVHLLVEFILFFQRYVEVLCAVRSFLRSDKEDICHVPHHLFKRLSVFSYIASRKNGSITNTITRAAVLVCVRGRRMKKSGTPIIAPPPKQMSCRFVKLKRNFVFTFVRRYV